MSKEKDYLDMIEEFDENNLPDIDINSEELKRVKGKVFSIIEKLKNSNKSLDFNITLDEALKLKERLGDNAEKAIYGVESAKLMRAIMLETIKENEGLKDEDIVDELLRDINAHYWWRGGAVCYKLFLTKDKLIIYSFDSHYKIFSNYKIRLYEIIEAGKAGKAKCMMDEEEQIIVLKDKVIYFDPKYGGKESDLLRFMESLKKAGVKDVDRSRFPWKIFLMKCTWVLCACVIIYLIFMVLNL